MAVETRTIELKTKADGGMHDLTDDTRKALADTGLEDGTVTLFCPGSTGTISTVEYEPGLIQDVPAALSRIAPPGIEYRHHETWHDDNGRGHVKATIMGPGITVPFIEGSLSLGTWQQIVFIECDTRDRNRRIILQFIGE